MKRYLASIFLFLVHTMVMAQPGGGGDPGGGEPVPLPGLGILVAVGAYLGVRTLIKNRNSKSQK
jgi:hypothetical protein